MTLLYKSPDSVAVIIDLTDITKKTTRKILNKNLSNFMITIRKGDDVIQSNLLRNQDKGPWKFDAQNTDEEFSIDIVNKITEQTKSIEVTNQMIKYGNA